MKHLSFPSIEQFRHVIKHVKQNAKYHGLALPVLEFEGTVKLHGTNAGIVYDSLTGDVYAQSRSNVLSLTQDNAGFCQYFETNREAFERWLKLILIPSFRFVTIYGEWAGGNIQKGVAINGLEKMFVVFALRYSDLDDENDLNSIWNFGSGSGFGIPFAPENIIPNLYNVYQFDHYHVTIDFNNPEEIQNQLVSITEAVEEECPVGKYFGKTGVGEGVVWHCVSNVDHLRQSDLIFKVKGEAHSSSKVRTLAAVDVEKINNIKELVSSIVTENRLNQGIQVLTEKGIDVTNSHATKEFINWVREDVVKEEKDTILESKLDFGSVIKQVCSNAGKWFNAR